MATLHRGFSASSILLLLLLVLVSSSSASPVHEILKKNALPPGIFPDTAKNYTLFSEGRILIQLDAPCYVQFDDLFQYGRVIWGKLEYGRISEISGIWFKQMITWIPITGIVAPANQDFVVLLFTLISKKYPAKNFKEIPSCRADESLPISEV
ncbi:hypothetical protein J5N97_011025 [Dioscorea zingiberensis]|uniref:Uncharacterized protein n=1 Tax=Dioscorea zingiberensis TaxID=325984 RepID=A0A9D5HMY8_9LILI|nr:hypothetical protein J5N97_011025 [Dioscorea zingiberensis]